MTLTYYRPETYSRLSGIFENPTIESNIIEVGQDMPFSVFSMSYGGHLDFGPYRCLNICNLTFLFSSYPNKVKSITISLWASDS